MPRYALHSAGVITNVIDADADWIAAHVPTADLVGAGVRVGVGFARVSAGNYTAPTPAPIDPPAPAQVRRWITPLAFLSRFTDAEAIAFDLASIGATEQAAALRRYMHKVNAARYIDLDRADTRAGVEALESAGLIAAGRAAEILDDPIVYAEEYRG